MRLYARQGRRGEALRQYQLCVGVLQRELRAEPEAETQHLYRELLRETAARGSVSAVPRAGTVRTPTKDAAGAPAPEGTLIGRQAELERMRQAWTVAARGHGQVVVIVGEAGI